LIKETLHLFGKYTQSKKKREQETKEKNTSLRFMNLSGCCLITDYGLR